jgi:hypothetical protein
LPNPVDQKLADELFRKLADVVKPSPLAEPRAEDDEYRKLLKQLHQTAMRELRLRLAVFQAGAKGGTIANLIESAQRVYSSEIALSNEQVNLQTAATRLFTIAKAMTAMNSVRYDVGQIAQQDLEQSRYFMIEAQVKALQSMQHGGKK